MTSAGIEQDIRLRPRVWSRDLGEEEERGTEGTEQQEEGRELLATTIEMDQQEEEELLDTSRRRDMAATRTSPFFSQQRCQRVASFAALGILLVLVVVLCGIVLTPPPMVCGVDPSEAYGVLDAGGIFTDERGRTVDPLGIIKQKGCQWVRLRIMVDPNGEYGLFQDLSYVVRMARHAKQIYGFKILLDFHYSHWWVDGGNQWSPDRWRTAYHGNETIPMDDLVTAVYQYTHRVLEVLDQEQALPDAVQIGNEISPGMLWPHGKLPHDWDDEDPPVQWMNLVRLLNAGTQAVQDVSSKPRIVIHLDTGGDAAFTAKWMSTFFKLGGSCDIIGLSWYPMWHGTVDDLVDNVNSLSGHFPRHDVWLVETAYYYKGYCEEHDLDCKKKFPYPMTETGQADFLTNLRETLLRRTRCRAIFYWGSHWTQPDKWFRGSEDWADAERRALFDENGRALAGLSTLPGHWLSNKKARWLG